MVFVRKGGSSASALKSRSGPPGAAGGPYERKRGHLKVAATEARKNRTPGKRGCGLERVLDRKFYRARRGVGSGGSVTPGASTGRPPRACAALVTVTGSGRRTGIATFSPSRMK